MLKIQTMPSSKQKIAQFLSEVSVEVLKDDITGVIVICIDENGLPETYHSHLYDADIVKYLELAKLLKFSGMLEG